MRMRRKPNLAARLERCSHIHVTDPSSLSGRWLDEFGFAELRLELGCGKGRFTVESAKAEPSVLFVALEKSPNVMVAALELAAAQGLKNVRFVDAYADDLLDFFAPGEVARIYINFCDPWPGNRHAKRRLTCGRFLEIYSQLLTPGGKLQFKTDNLPLFEFSLQEFERCGFVSPEVVRDLHANGPVGIMTDYERRFVSQGLPIYQCVTGKVEVGDGGVRDAVVSGEEAGDGGAD